MLSVLSIATHISRNAHNFQARVSTAALEPASALAVIDEEIAVHESAVRELRTRRNSYSPTSKFPNELISEIFIIVKAMSTVPLSYGETRDRGGGWLNVAGVCRAWRDIALNTPRLWNEMDTSCVKSLEWTSTMLARSKAAPLFVECMSGLSGRLQPLREEQRLIEKEIFKHIARIQQLHIYADYSTLLELFTPSSGSAITPATKLQSLRINPTPSPTPFPALMSQVLKVPLPSLHTLILLSVDLPPDIPVLPHLRHLTVKSVSRSMSIGLLLSLLRSTPFLEELEFQHDRAGMSAGEINDRTTVELPRLTQLLIKTSYSESAALFQYINYPPSSRVRFECTAEVPLPLNLADVVLCFANSVVAAKVDEVSILKILSSQLQLKASVGNVSWLDIICYRLDSSTVELLKLANKLPSSSIRTLALSGRFPLIERTTWMDLFDYFGHAEELKVEDADEAFMQMLMKPQDDEWIPFPILKKFTLVKGLFNNRLTSAIKSFVAERKALEGPDSAFQLELSRCDIHLSIVRELEQCGALHWDSATLHSGEILGINAFIDEEDDGEDEYNGYDGEYDDPYSDIDSDELEAGMSMVWQMG